MVALKVSAPLVETTVGNIPTPFLRRRAVHSAPLPIGDALQRSAVVRLSLSNHRLVRILIYGFIYDRPLDRSPITRNTPATSFAHHFAADRG